jgi:hypothetical protein
MEMEEGENVFLKVIDGLFKGYGSERNGRSVSSVQWLLAIAIGSSQRHFSNYLKPGREWASSFRIAIN